LKFRRQHAGQTLKDQQRTGFLEAQGYRVLRFWNNDVLGNLDGVLEAILREVGRWPPHPGPLPLKGERE